MRHIVNILFQTKYLQKILGKVDIFIKNVQIVIELYQNGAVRSLNSKNELIPVINIYYVQINYQN